MFSSRLWHRSLPNLSGTLRLAHYVQYSASPILSAFVSSKVFAKEKDSKERTCNSQSLDNSIIAAATVGKNAEISSCYNVLNFGIRIEGGKA